MFVAEAEKVAEELDLGRMSLGQDDAETADRKTDSKEDEFQQLVAKKAEERIQRGQKFTQATHRAVSHTDMNKSLSGWYGSNEQAKLRTRAPPTFISLQESSDLTKENKQV